jgi:hypothetical protein
MENILKFIRENGTLILAFTAAFLVVGLLLKHCKKEKEIIFVPETKTIVKIDSVEKKVVSWKIKYKFEKGKTDTIEKRIVIEIPDTCTTYIDSLICQFESERNAADSTIHYHTILVNLKDSLISIKDTNFKALQLTNDSLIKSNKKARLKAYFKGMTHGALLGAGIGILILKQ